MVLYWLHTTTQHQEPLSVFSPLPFVTVLSREGSDNRMSTFAKTFASDPLSFAECEPEVPSEPSPSPRSLSSGEELDVFANCSSDLAPLCLHTQRPRNEEQSLVGTRVGKQTARSGCVFTVTAQNWNTKHVLWQAPCTNPRLSLTPHDCLDGLIYTLSSATWTATYTWPRETLTSVFLVVILYFC